MSREKVSRLRQLLSEAVPQTTVAPSVEETDAWRRYQAFAENDPLPDHDTSPRARRVRNVNRIAIWYGWTREIQRFLDNHDAASISSLDDELVERLHDHFVTLEQCVQEGCDPPDTPAAR
jgi:hypothetical protein